MFDNAWTRPHLGYRGDGGDEGTPRWREYWQQVDAGLVANTPGIRSAWSAFETSMRGMTTSIELPIWANRAPGSNAMPMTILVPPYSLFPELRGG